jgi:hypothetical protein
MRRLATVLFFLLLAGRAAADSHPPLRSMIVSMAQHFVQEEAMFGSLGHYHVEFDVTYLHPQPEPDYWAVVGGFISEQSTPNSYVAALRLVCPEFEKVACWRLEKLAVNGTVIVDRGKPL